MSRLINIVPILFCYLFVVGCNSKKKELFPIPVEVEMVAKVDLSRLTKKVALEKITELSSWDLFSQQGKDSSKSNSLLEKIISNPSESGIDYLNEIYLFKKKEQWYLIARLDDKNKFDQFCKSFSDSKMDYRRQFINDSNFSAHWNNHFLISNISNSDNFDSLHYLLNIPPNKTFFNASIQDSISNSESDVIIFSNFKQLLSEELNPDYINLFPYELTISKLNFEKGNIKIEIERLLNSNLEKVFNTLTTTSISKLNKEKTLSFTTMYVGIDEAEKILTKNNNSLLQNFQINPSLLFHTFQGQIEFVCNNISKKTSIFKSYELDDDFNKIETMDSSIFYYPNFTLSIPLKEEVSMDDILTKFVKANFLTKKNGNLYQLQVSQIPIYIELNKQDKILFISDSTTRFISTGSVESIQNKDSICFFSFLNFKKLPRNFITGQEKLNEVVITGTKNQKGNIKFSIDISLFDKDKSSIVSLVELLKKGQS